MSFRDVDGKRRVCVVLLDSDGGVSSGEGTSGERAPFEIGKNARCGGDTVVQYGDVRTQSDMLSLGEIKQASSEKRTA